MSQHLWTNARLCAEGRPNVTLSDASLVVEQNRIVWLGASNQLPNAFHTYPRTDLQGRWVTPGLIDCHTHLIYGGNRADEFARRLAGVSYETIAREGGGILSTVRATRAASEDELFTQAAGRLIPLLAEGVTAMEIKSGYGLDLANERKMLRVARRLGEIYPVSIYTTFLGAHALPPEFANRPDDYIDYLIDIVLPSLADEGLVDAVDAFCENIAFSAAQCERLFEAAAQRGLPIKAHAEQLSHQGGAALVARYYGLSADHLEWLNDEDCAQMAMAGTVAVLLPTAFYFMRETRVPPIDKLRSHGISIAIATDSNPGTAPTSSLLLAMHQACTLFRLTFDEALAGVTHHAACALGAAERHGTLEIGRQADFVVWSVDTLPELAYWMGRPICERVIRGGKEVYRRK
ncbi:MAG: imidazolonepropionase [Pseudomonadota bacterium]